MTSFFENIDPELATEIDQLSRLIYELRENHNTVLQSYRAENAAVLLEQIYGGNVPEHPGYEHYLAARILADTRETVRTVLSERLKEANQS